MTGGHTVTDGPQDGLDTVSRARLESLLDQHARQRLRDQRVDLDEWAGGLPQHEKAQVPTVRLARRWFNVLWLLPIGVVGLLLAIALAQQLRQYGWMQNFIARYPG